MGCLLCNETECVRGFKCRRVSQSVCSTPARAQAVRARVAAPVGFMCVFACVFVRGGVRVRRSVCARAFVSVHGGICEFLCV